MNIIDFLIGPSSIDFLEEEEEDLGVHTTLCKARTSIVFIAFRRLGFVIYGILALQFVIIGTKIGWDGDSESQTYMIPLGAESIEVCERKNPEVCYHLTSKDFYVILPPEGGYTQATNTGDIAPRK